jgi:hypothetical protein
MNQRLLGDNAAWRGPGINVGAALFFHIDG